MEENVLTRIINEFPDEEFVIIDGYDNAVIGFDVSEMRLVYDKDKMIKCLVEEQEMDEEEALEWFYYNTVRSLPYVGQTAPIIVDRSFEEYD